MRIHWVVISLVFCGLIALYIAVGHLGGGAQLTQDRLISLEAKASQALQYERPDLALKYYDKAIRTAQRAERPQQVRHFQSLKSKISQKP